MAYKKNWIFLKRGLITDPSHRKKLGELIWLYMYILDRADWETGSIPDWSDRVEAEELNMPLRTLRDQRRKLEAIGYIQHIKGQHKSNLLINKWINPKRYDGQILNIPQSDTPLPLYPQSDTQSDTQSDASPSQNLDSSLAHKSQIIVTPTNEIKKAYESLLGYSLHGEWKAGEGRAAKIIGQSFTVDQLSEAYKHYKADKFWKDKRLTLHYLSEQMPELFSNTPQQSSNESIRGRKEYI